MLPLDAADKAPSSIVQRAHAFVSSRDGWPHLTLELELQHAQHSKLNLSRSHVYQVALASRGASTIEYKGDAGSGGGYDVCCNFRKESRCELRHRDAVVAALARGGKGVSGGGEGGEGEGGGGAKGDGGAAAATGGATDSKAAEGNCMAAAREWHELRDVHYAAHDCPLPSAFNASVTKPLHFKAAGAWAAILLMSDGDVARSGGSRSSERSEAVAVTGCVAVVFDVTFAPQPPLTAPPSDEAARRLRGFDQVSHGKSCRDGGDLLEVRARYMRYMR